MAFYEFPGSDFHDLNLDWLLQQMKNCLAEWAATKAQWETLSADNEAFKTQIQAEWDELRQFVTDYFANLDVSEEISSKINEMAQDGSLLTVIYGIVTETTATASSAWLAENVAQETGYVIDTSLSIANAAADAKYTGIAADAAKSMAASNNLIEIPVQWRFLWANGSPYGWQMGYWTEEGNAQSSTQTIRSNFKIRTIPDDNVRYPALFYRASALAIEPPANMPVGTSLRIYEFTNSACTARYDITARTTIKLTQGCQYTINTRGSGTDVSSYLTIETFENMHAVMYCYKPDDAAFRTFDLSKTVNQAVYNRHGWTPGNGENSSNVDKTTSVFNPIRWGWRDNRGYYAVNVSFVDTTDNPDVKLYGNLYYLSEGSYTYIATIPLDPGTPIYLMPNTCVGFVVSNLTQEPAEALSSGWLDNNVKFEILYRNIIVKLPYYREFDRFYVSYDANWPERGTSDSEIPEENNKDILCAISIPSTYKAIGKPSPVIMYCHGSGGYIDGTTWYTTSANFKKMIRALTAAGFIVFDVNNTHDNPDGFGDWGCLPLVRAYRAAWEYVRENYNVESKLYILSSSMGTMANLSFMKMFGSDVIASMMTAPRVGLINRYETSDNPEAKKEMLVAYGLEPDSILEDDTFVLPDSSVFNIQSIRGFAHGDFIPMIGDMPVVPLHFPPIKVIIGLADNSYDSEKIRQFFDGLTNAGNITFVRSVANMNHSEATFLSVGTMREEMVEWFNSFRK